MIANLLERASLGAFGLYRSLEASCIAPADNEKFCVYASPVAVVRVTCAQLIEILVRRPPISFVTLARAAVLRHRVAHAGTFSPFSSRASMAFNSSVAA